MIDPTAPAVALLKLGGTLLPGVIEQGGVSGFARKTDYKVAKGKGSDGASLTDEGDPPPEGKVKLTLWTAGQLAAWDAAYAMLRAARAAKTALDIEQPIVNQLEVTSVVVKSISQVTYEGKGRWTVELELMQWLPSPKPAGGKPGGSAADSGTPAGPGAGPPGTAPGEQTASEKELSNLVDEALK